MPKNFSLVCLGISNTKEKQPKDNVGLSATKVIKNVIKDTRELNNQVIVIKLPSSIIVNDILLNNFVENIYFINACGAKVCIIHDHTNLVETTLLQYGVSNKRIENFKSAAQQYSLFMEMVISGYINKLIVSKLCRIGCYAIGISGKDCNLLQAQKSKLLHKRRPGKDVIGIEFVSKPVLINPEILLNFEDNNVIPVIAPIASDKNGRTHLLDVDLTTSIISSTIEADRLILPYEDEIFEGKDVKFKDVHSLQKFLKSKDFTSKTISLLEAGIHAIEMRSLYCVHFVNAKSSDNILLSLFGNSEFV